MVRQLINLEDHAVIVHLAYRGEGGDVVGDRPAGADEAWVVHVGEAGVSAFQQRGGGGDILIAPQLTSCQLDEEVGLASSQVLASLPEITATFAAAHPTVWPASPAGVWLRLAGRPAV